MTVDSRSRVENILNVALNRLDESVLEPSQSRVETLLMLLNGTIGDIADVAGKLPIHICVDGEYNPLSGMPTISNPETDIFYLVPSGSGNNVYDEWVYTGSGWEQFGGGGTAAIPNFTIGTVTTLPAGSSATVTITGTTSDPVLNFGIPKGDTGATGSTGTTFTPSVSSAGVISWTNDGGKTNPASVDIVTAVINALPSAVGVSF